MEIHKSIVLQIQIVMCVIWWLLYWFLLPIKFTHKWMDEIDRLFSSRFLGTTGTIFTFQALPAILSALLSYIVVGNRRRRKPADPQKKRNRKPTLNVWTLPIFVKSPLGMLTIGDLIFILVTLFVTFWFLVKSSWDASREIDRVPVPPGMPSRWVSKLQVWGDYAGVASLIPFALLWIPVSRGSPLLRVMGVPFEHVIRHHIWLGSLTIWLSAVHTAFLMVYLVHERHINDVLSWHTHWTRNACIPGMAAMAAGILMLVTAMGVIRRKFYDLFFRVHHLYLAYLVFFAFHSVAQMYILIVPVLLFFLDRFMRMVQSRKAVDIVSAKVLPSGAIELRFAKPKSLTYDALSFVYVLLPSVSRLQWHPFSVASSPLDKTNEISVYIKPLGKFTKSLHDALIVAKHCRTGRDGRPVLLNCPFSFEVALEGPYGDESCFYLRYERLVMVAGGIGVTPFLAILRDILYRYRMSQEGLPSTVLLIFCCRQAYELDILDTLAPSTIFPGYDKFLDIKIHAYVTTKVELVKQKIGADDINTWTDVSIDDESNFININDTKLMYKKLNSPKGPRRMSAILSAGHVGWVGASVLATVLGFIGIWGFFNITLLTPSSHNYARVLFYLLSIFLGVVFFGGGVIFFWASFEWKRNKSLNTRVMSSVPTRSPPPENVEKDVELNAKFSDFAVWKGDLISGRRPNWKEIFDKLAIDFDGEDVGVVVSGSKFMQEEVAKECKKHSISRDSSVMMHYHSCSFEF